LLVEQKGVIEEALAGVEDDVRENYRAGHLHVNDIISQTISSDDISNTSSHIVLCF
jgi:hypothetical protein